MNAPATKRRQIFIKKEFQGRFILGAFAVILLAGLCSSALVYWITDGDLQAQSMSAHANLTNASDRLGVSILIGNLVSIVIAGVVAVTSVVYASHKIAGPLYRFERLCNDVGEGKLNTITHLREHDQLQELAQSFAAMVDKLREQRNQRQVVLDAVQQQLAALFAENDAGLNAEQQTALRSIESAVAELDRINRSET